MATIKGTTYGAGARITRAAIRNLKDFTTSGALKGQWEENGKYYRVYSYQMVIAEYCYGWSTDDRKVSATTSRHQSLVRLALNTDI